jgi:hypothetical protein
MKLKLWPNKLGYDSGDWEFIPLTDNDTPIGHVLDDTPPAGCKWRANYKPRKGPWLTGTGATINEAKKNAQPTGY